MQEVFVSIVLAVKLSNLYFLSFHKFKVQVGTSEQQAGEHLSQSQKYQTQAVTALRESLEIEDHAKKILHTVENYEVVAEQARTQAQKFVQDASELTQFHRSKIDYAVNISQSLESSYNRSHSLSALAEEAENHARKENEVGSSEHHVITDVKITLRLVRIHSNSFPV